MHWGLQNKVEINSKKPTSNGKKKLIHRKPPKEMPLLWFLESIFEEKKILHLIISRDVATKNRNDFPNSL